MKVFLRAIYSAILLGAGVLHFFNEKSFRRIIPTILPFRKAAVLITGVFVIILSSLLSVQKGQSITRCLLALVMAAMFPAHIYMAIERIQLLGRVKANLGLVWLNLP